MRLLRGQPSRMVERKRLDAEVYHSRFISCFVCVEFGVVVVGSRIIEPMLVSWEIFASSCV